VLSGEGLAVAGLRLEAVEFVDLTRWRWALTDDSGVLLADHEVRLDASSWQFAAFADLVGYLSWQAAPDQQVRDEARIVAGLGEWIGAAVFGPVAAAMVRARPVTVRVAAQAGAEELLARPLELAHAGGRPLAVQDVTLVMETDPGDGAGGAVPVGERLRMLGLFSLPEGRQPLNLRRERYSMVQLFQRIAREGKAADVRVLQYGVTRERLRDVLGETEGWDVVHVSGHASPGQLLLETDEGKPEWVSAEQLADLLDAARGRLKLVTISACWSAAVAVAEQRRVLGLPVQDQAAPERAGGSHDANPVPASLATKLARRLGCAVLAMRYPVTDEFAAALSEKLYELLAGEGKPLPEAVGTTLLELAPGSDGSGPGGIVFPALSVATPALFGGSALGLRLAAPDHGKPERDDAVTGTMAGFPPQPARFVGRTGVMTRANAALAARSGVPGVVLQGMPGGGKTACALELAYGQAHAFDRLIWYKAPDEGTDVSGALDDLAHTLERYFDDFQMARALAEENQLTAFLPRLTELMERNRLLLVIDNAESLLTTDGQWHDEQWGAVTGALAAHAGPGRLILTSRRAPVGLAGLRAEAVDALSADEAMLLARELRNLDALVRGDVTGIGGGAAQELARHALDAARGHPKLLEFADGQAADPEWLADLVKAGDQAWRKLGRPPREFSAAGEPTIPGEDYLDVLAAWTRVVTQTLAPGERELFWFLCCLEERDRERATLDGSWAGLRAALGRDGQPPGLGEALSVLAARGLAAIRAEADAGESYAIHPAVGDAGRARAGKPFQGAVDAEASRYWAGVFSRATGGTDEATDTGLLVRAGLAAVPYLMRQEQWMAAAVMLERAFNRDPSKSNASAMRLAAGQIAAREKQAFGLLARMLMVIDKRDPDRLMRGYMETAVTRGDYSAAALAAMWLVDFCWRRGRIDEASQLADTMIGYTRQAGHGPWTVLADEAQRLQVVSATGQQADYVLAEVQRLRIHMESLPAVPGQDEVVPRWQVREMLLDVGRNAARQLECWQEALDLNAEIIASKQGRNAPAPDIARARFSDYYPLLQRGRAEEALSLLQECRKVAEDADDNALLGITFAGLADVESALGHGDAAIRLTHDALRYKYRAENVIHIANSYHRLGDYLLGHARQPAAALTCHLAAALIGALTGAEGADDSVNSAAIDLREAGDDAAPPADAADLCRRLADIPGTDLTRLLKKLKKDSTDTDATDQDLRTLIARARALAAAPPKHDNPA
jgi:tetratricopeptide (TPR) repeat protein